MNIKIAYLGAACSLVGVILLVAAALTRELENPISNKYSIATWTLSKICVDGTQIYQLADGDYAIFRGDDETDQHWVKLSEGVDPEDYCR